jgi:hypothetical protein
LRQTRTMNVQATIYGRMARSLTAERTVSDDARNERKNGKAVDVLNSLRKMAMLAPPQEVGFHVDASPTETASRAGCRCLPTWWPT